MSIDQNTKLIWYNMNTMMKSELEIAYDGKQCICKGRYDHKGIIELYDDLLDEVSNCQYGRDFGNDKWLKILEKRYEKSI